MPTPPHPGTAVNAVARSIVWRMKRRLSIARTWSAGSSGGGLGRGRGEAMGTRIPVGVGSIKYFTV